MDILEYGLNGCLYELTIEYTGLAENCGDIEYESLYNITYGDCVWHDAGFVFDVDVMDYKYYIHRIAKVLDVNDDYCVLLVEDRKKIREECADCFIGFKDINSVETYKVCILNPEVY